MQSLTTEIEARLDALRTEINVTHGPALRQLEATHAIADANGYAAIADIGLRAHLFDQKVEEEFTPWKGAARELHLAICAEERAYREVPQRVKQLAGDLCRQWDADEAQRQRDEEERQSILAEANAIMERETQLDAMREVAEASGDAELAAEADLVAQEPVHVPQTRVQSTRGRAITRSAPKHKPTYDGRCTDLQKLVMAVAEPIVLRRVAGMLGDRARMTTGEEATWLHALEAELLRQLTQMPSVPLSALEPSSAWLKVEATRTKELFAVPGCELVTNTKTQFSRR